MHKIFSSGSGFLIVVLVTVVTVPKLSADIDGETVLQHVASGHLFCEGLLAFTPQILRPWSK